MTTNHEFNVRQNIRDKKIKVEIDENHETPVYMHISDGEYIEHENDTFRNMYYIEEEKRGFFPEENLVVPGRFEIDIPKNFQKEIEFICSLEENIDEISVKKVINKEIIRINELMYKTDLLDKKGRYNKIIKERVRKKKYIKRFCNSC